jgi:hypothetical protein
MIILAQSVEKCYTLRNAKLSVEVKPVRIESFKPVVSSNEDNERLFELFTLALSEERFCYDNTGKWRFLCMTPEEVKEMANLLGVKAPQKVEFKPDSKTGSKLNP